VTGRAHGIMNQPQPPRDLTPSGTGRRTRARE
jgi:hypothetical protein